MRDVGLTATELGPDGFLPSEARGDGTRPFPASTSGRRRVHTPPAPRSRTRPGTGGGPPSRRLRRRGRLDPGAVVRQRPGRLRQPSRTGRQGLADAAGQPQPHQPDHGRATESAPCCTAQRHRRSRTPPEVHRVLDGRPSRCGRRPGTADRRHDPARAHPAGRGLGRARALQGRRREQGEARPGRALDLHRGCHPRHVPASGHGRRGRRRDRGAPDQARLRRLVHPRAGHHPRGRAHGGGSGLGRPDERGQPPRRAAETP